MTFNSCLCMNSDCFLRWRTFYLNLLVVCVETTVFYMWVKNELVMPMFETEYTFQYIHNLSTCVALKCKSQMLISSDTTSWIFFDGSQTKWRNFWTQNHCLLVHFCKVNCWNVINLQTPTPSRHNLNSLWIQHIKTIPIRFVSETIYSFNLIRTKPNKIKSESHCKVALQLRNRTLNRLEISNVDFCFEYYSIWHES